MKKILAIGCVTLSLAACTATERGAGIGAATGAVVGGAVTGDVRGAAVGAAVGGASGALIGSVMLLLESVSAGLAASGFFILVSFIFINVKGRSS